MNNNEKKSFLKGKGAAAGVVLCFVAVIAMVGTFTFKNYKKNLNEQMTQTQNEVAQLTDENSAEANTGEITKSEVNTSGTDGTDSMTGLNAGDLTGTEQPADENGTPGGTGSADTTEGTGQTNETSSYNTSNVWFDESSTLEWPANGATLISYSMDQTVYFSTLEQYKYNPAIIIGGEVGEEISAAASGVVEAIEESAQTGTTVTLNMGNGYTAVYGQLKDVQVSQGEYVPLDGTIGYLNEPTKYYSVEGPNLYFKVMKDGVPVDPLDFME